MTAGRQYPIRAVHRPETRSVEPEEETQMKTQDAVFFITGANRGLGLAVAREALKRGARRVYAGVRNPTDADTPGVVQVRLEVHPLYLRPPETD